MNRAITRGLALAAVALAILETGCANYGAAGGADPKQPNGFRTVVVDAGHGGHDSGGRGNGLVEKQLTLDTAKDLESDLRAMGFRVVMTRRDDTFYLLDDRVAMANAQRGNNAVLVSVHYDASGRSGNGCTTFYWRVDSHGLAVRVQQALVAETGLNNVGVVRRRLRLTRNPDIPCLLVECGYMTSKSDAAKISQPEFRARVAMGIAKGLRSQFELGDAGIPSVPELHEPLSQASDRREY
jgi:N-acetylmuramoyl-L-alanine amidase